MRNKNRITAFFLAIMLVMSAFAINAGAQTVLSDKELIDVKAFRLLEDEAKLGEPISRAMFAKLTVRLVNMEQVAYSMGSADYFPDVPDTHWANIYINLLRSLEIVSGNGTTSFYPDRGITYNEALKILVGAMGCTIYAQREGGYPYGYAAVAARLGMTKDVEPQAELTYADAMQLFYNCLDINLTEQVAGAEEYIVTDISPRDILLGNQSVGMVKLRGIVQANFNSYLDAPISRIEEDEILFYDMLMKTGTSGVQHYLGQEVDVYVSTNNDGVYTVVEVIPTVNNEVTTVAFNDICDFSENKLVYMENSRNKNLDITGATILYNGRPTDYNTAKRYMDNGSVTLISNDGNDDIDVIFIDNYVSAVVETINLEGKYIVLGGNKTVNGQKVLRFDGSDENLRFYFRDAQGKEIEPSEIENGDLISIFADLNGKLITVRKGSAVVTGEIEEIGTDESTLLTINGEKYIAEKGAAGNVRTGMTVTAKLNFENKIGHMKESKDSVLYAAIIQTGKKSLQNTQVKMLLPGNIANETEQADDADDDAIVSLAARNSALEIMTLANRVNYCGKWYDEEEVKSRIDKVLSGIGYLIAEYRLNSAGEISYIDIPEQVGTPYSKIYNADERTFGATAGGAFGVCEETLAICVPSNAVESDMDYLSKIKMNDGQSYYVNSYVYNDDTYCVDLLVIKERMVYQTTGSISTTSKIGLVDKITTRIGDGGEPLTYITLVTNTGKAEKVLSENTSSSFNFSSLKKGDFIYYSLDTLDRIDGAEIIAHSNPIPPSRVDTKTYSVYSGYIADTDYNVVSETLNRWTDTLHFTTEDGGKRSFEIRKSGTPPIYIYNTNTRTAYAGTSLDFMRSHQRVVICTVGTTVKAVLMIL